jgi:hypothetical protein
MISFWRAGMRCFLVCWAVQAGFGLRCGAGMSGRRSMTTSRIDRLVAGDSKFPIDADKKDNGDGDRHKWAT